jgi:hypothetical protein
MHGKREYILIFWIITESSLGEKDERFVMMLEFLSVDFFSTI